MPSPAVGDPLRTQTAAPGRRARSRQCSLEYRHSLLDAPLVSIACAPAAAGRARRRSLALRAAQAAQPACLALISPWCDLSNTRLAHVPFDPLLSARRLEFCASTYAPHRGRSDPSVSPLLEKLSCLPPMLDHVAGQEVLLEDLRRLAAACARAGVPCQLREFGPLWHDFQLYAGVVPEATQSVKELAAFARRHAP